MAVEIANWVHAVAVCQGLGLEYVQQDGFVGAITNPSTGRYLLTLAQPVGARILGNVIVQVTSYNTQRTCLGFPDAVDGSTIEAQFYDLAGVINDASLFSVVVLRLPVAT